MSLSIIAARRITKRTSIMHRKKPHTCKWFGTQDGPCLTLPARWLSWACWFTLACICTASCCGGLPNGARETLRPLDRRLRGGSLPDRDDESDGRACQGDGFHGVR